MKEDALMNKTRAKVMHRFSNQNERYIFLICAWFHNPIVFCRMNVFDMSDQFSLENIQLVVHTVDILSPCGNISDVGFVRPKPSVCSA